MRIKSYPGCIGSSPTSRDGATEPTMASAISTSTSTPTSSSYVGIADGISRPTSIPALVSDSESADQPGAISSATRGNGRPHTRTRFSTWSGPRGSTAPRTTPWNTVAVFRRPRRGQTAGEALAVRTKETEALRVPAEADGRGEEHEAVRPPTTPSTNGDRERLSPPYSRWLEDHGWSDRLTAHGRHYALGLRGQYA